jgi:hypothetical protein
MDYGIKTSKKGKSALSQNYTDILMSSRFPLAKIDQTKENSFRTTNITFLSNTLQGVTTLIASFKHGYDYDPQMWGLWDITWGPGTLVSGLRFNGYGSVSSSTGIPVATLWYEKDEINVYLYVRWSDPFGMTPIDLTGTTASLTTYVFADDLTEQDYTI